MAYIFWGSLALPPNSDICSSSEWVFSSSAETDTKKHNWINPVMMEALQMLKFALKKAHLDFMRGWIILEWLMREQGAKEDLLTQLFGNDGEDAMDKIIQQLVEDDSEKYI